MNESMNTKTAVATLNVSVAQAINEARARYLSSHLEVRPTRVFLGENAYDQLHSEAEAAGMPGEPYPTYEDDRLEYRGMKVHCHRSAHIDFE